MEVGGVGAIKYVCTTTVGKFKEYGCLKLLSTTS